LSKEPRGGAIAGICFGTAFFCRPPATLEAERGSRTSRTDEGRCVGAVVVAAENAEREFVEIMWRIVTRIS